MLRRPATTITLTAADLDAYEVNRQRKAWEKQQQAQAAQSHNGVEKGKETAVRPQQWSQKDRIMGGQSRQDAQTSDEESVDQEAADGGGDVDMGDDAEWH